MNTNNSDLATSTETSKELCRELGIDPEKWWGRVNNYLCDAYHEGRQDARNEYRAADVLRGGIESIRSAAGAND